MSTQKMAIFGATGEVGRQVAEEALKRGHSVTAVVRTEQDLQLKHPNLKVIKGDASKPEEIAKHAKGHDVVIGFHTPIQESPMEHVTATRAFIEGTKKAGVKNLVAVGHDFEKKQGANAQQSADARKPISQANSEALKLFRNETELNWTYACRADSPKSEQQRGEQQRSESQRSEQQKGEQQKGERQPDRTSEELVFTQPHGESKVQARNFSQALVDEAEKSEHEHLAHQEDEEL